MGGSVNLQSCSVFKNTQCTSYTAEHILCVRVPVNVRVSLRMCELVNLYARLGMNVHTCAYAGNMEIVFELERLNVSQTLF